MTGEDPPWIRRGSARGGRERRYDAVTSPSTTPSRASTCRRRRTPTPSHRSGWPARRPCLRCPPFPRLVRSSPPGPLRH